MKLKSLSSKVLLLSICFDFCLRIDSKTSSNKVSQFSNDIINIDKYGDKDEDLREEYIRNKEVAEFQYSEESQESSSSSNSSSSSSLSKKYSYNHLQFRTIVVLGDERLAMIVGNQVWYYVMIDNMVKKYADYGPKIANKTDELFPSFMTGSLTIDYEKHYFFRDDRHCLRKIESIQESEIGYEEEESIQVYKVDASGNKLLVSQNEIGSSITTIVDESSMCVWKDNSRLFGCFTNRDHRLIDLCKDPTVIGALGYNNNIYIFTPLKVYVFDGKYTAMLAFGKLITDQFQPQLIWKHLDSINGGYFSWDNNLYSISEDTLHFTSWDSKGKIVNNNEMIFNEDDCLNINGAIIMLANSRIAVVVKHLV